MIGFRRLVLLAALAVAAPSLHAAEAADVVAAVAPPPAPPAAVTGGLPPAPPVAAAPAAASPGPDAPDSAAVPPAADAAAVPPAAPVLAAAPPPPRRLDRRCAPDGRTCIGRTTYVADVCRTIEAAAGAHALDPGFFARLVWRESLFDAAAVSPAGAQGIAQFMPETGRLRGLGDPFNPAEALVVSAAYLADLAATFGNIGLAAVAYNGGENRAARFVAREGGLPAETRDYVRAITGHSAETWRDAPPAAVDLALAKGAPFHDACVAHAATRTLRQFPASDPVSPWGVIVASHRERDGAERMVSRLRNRHGAVLADERVAYARARLPGRPLRLYNAQVGRDTRAEADAFCARLRAAGGDCMVLRN